MGPSLPTSRIMSGVATATSKSSQPPWIFSTRSASPTHVAPAWRASSALSPLAKTRIFFSLRKEWGSTRVSRMECLALMFRFMEMPTVASNLA